MNATTNRGRQVDDTTSRTTGRSWLTPADALTRYAPGAQSSIGLTEKRDEIVRYGARIGNIGLVIPAQTPCEVVDRSTVYVIPRTSGHFAGLINLRGNLVPVFDLHVLLGIDVPPQRPLLVLNRGGDAVALPIDALPEVVAVGQKISQLPYVPDTLQPYLRGGYLDTDRIWIDVDLDRLFRALGESVGGL